MPFAELISVHRFHLKVLSGSSLAKTVQSRTSLSFLNFRQVRGCTLVMESNEFNRSSTRIPRLLCGCDSRCCDFRVSERCNSGINIGNVRETCIMGAITCIIHEMLSDIK